MKINEEKWKQYVCKNLIYGKNNDIIINLIFIFEHYKEVIIIVKLIIGYYWKYLFVDNKNFICYRFFNYSLFLPKRYKMPKT